LVTGDLINVRFSNRPSGVKHFQAIRHASVDVAHGLVLVHVPYRGTAPALADLLAGQVQVVFDNIPGSIGHIKTGKVRALGVTAPKRVAAIPDVPTIGETVSGYEVSNGL
jgi:tripartite-type tricarboxylate transporter receptor subunit TctC